MLRSSFLPNKKCPRLRAFSLSFQGLKLLGEGDGAGLFAFFTVGDFEFNLVAFVQRTETARLNFRIVHEQIRATFGGDEAVAFFTVKPLDCTFCTSSHLYISWIYMSPRP